MGDVLGAATTYEAARLALYELVDAMPLRLERLDRRMLEQRAAEGGGQARTTEQSCVNYLRHTASGYDDIIRRLDRPDELGLGPVGRHVLHVEKRRLKARAKRRVLDEIAKGYPWLREECERQAFRDGVEGDPGDFVLPFGPFKGRRLREAETDYLVRQLGLGSVQKSFRTRIERHLAERFARLERRAYGLSEPGAGTAAPVPEDVVERLRRSALGSAAGEYDRGREAGRRWACDRADAEGLARLGRLRERAGGDWPRLFRGGADSRAVAERLAEEAGGGRFWEEAAGAADPHPEFVRGFAEAALEVWGQVKSRL